LFSLAYRFIRRSLDDKFQGVNDMEENDSHKRLLTIILLISVLVITVLSCSETDQVQIATVGAQLKETAMAESKKFAETQAVQLKETALAQFATQLANVSTQLAKTTPSPWDTNWLPSDSTHVASKINSILSGTGLEGKGEVITKYSLEFGVNPAFALAMFRKEASFADTNTRAYINKNPGNIIATGECRGLPKGSKCDGYYGEISTDGRFGVYASMNDGIKAYFLLLNNEYKPGTPRNCSDIRCIITAYCPPSECDSETYESQITNWTRQYQEIILTP